MRDIPVVLSGYKLTVVEPPTAKTREDGVGGQVVVTDRNGVTQFVVQCRSVRRGVGSAGVRGCPA